GTAWYAYSADTLASMSQVLQQEAVARGRTSEANSYYSQYTNYSGLATAVRSAYTNLNTAPEHWIHYDQNGNITSLFYNSQADCVVALFFNMVPGNQRANVIDILLHGSNGIENFYSS